MFEEILVWLVVLAAAAVAGRPLLRSLRGGASACALADDADAADGASPCANCGLSLGAGLKASSCPAAKASAARPGAERVRISAD